MAERKIYVAALGAYNNGILHGAWVDAELGEDHIWDSIQEILASSPVPGEEEWAIHDYEGFGSIRLDENESPETIELLSDLFEAHGEVPVSYAFDVGVRPEEIGEFLEDAYRGSVASPNDEHDWAWDYLEDSGQMQDLPDWLSGGALQAAVNAWFNGMVNGGVFRVVRDGGDGSTHIFEVV